jgi:serine protease Do
VPALKPMHSRPGRPFLLPGCCTVPAVTLALLLACCAAQARVHGRQNRPPGRASSGSPVAARPVLPSPGYLGVGLRDLDASEATRLHLHGAMGAEIVTVDRDAPAWTAGLRRGDIVINFNGEPVDGLEDLRKRLRACTEGETVTLRVSRHGDEHTVAVTLGDEQAIAEQALQGRVDPIEDTPGPQEALQSGARGTQDMERDFVTPSPPAPANTSRGMASTLLDALIPTSYSTGLEVDPLTPQLAVYFGVAGRRGLLVTSVSLRSPAEAAGLAAGDVILSASGKPVSSRSALAHAVRASRGMPMTLVVQRNRREMTLTLLSGRNRRH